MFHTSSHRFLSIYINTIPHSPSTIHPPSNIAWRSNRAFPFHIRGHSTAVRHTRPLRRVSAYASPTHSFVSFLFPIKPPLHHHPWRMKILVPSALLPFPFPLLCSTSACIYLHFYRPRIGSSRACTTKNRRNNTVAHLARISHLSCFPHPICILTLIIEIRWFALRLVSCHISLPIHLHLCHLPAICLVSYGANSILARCGCYPRAHASSSYRITVYQMNGHGLNSEYNAHITALDSSASWLIGIDVVC
ncbi:hypothetical protein C8R45DRAFT_334456 [Mycena sanguinolenta]|nr:hypothetical protein C8R45DRAFT_334456 [Mycena sanguinolenta]